jgi:nucleotide-binding universal stress UspA family protein
MTPGRAVSTDRLAGLGQTQTRSDRHRLPLPGHRPRMAQQKNAVTAAKDELADPATLEETARRTLADGAAGVDLARVGAEVEQLLIQGRAAPALIGAARDSSLLVVGSRGRGGFAGLLLGSVSQQVVHEASVPVIMIPPAATVMDGHGRQWEG